MKALRVLTLIKLFLVLASGFFMHGLILADVRYAFDRGSSGGLLDGVSVRVIDGIAGVAGGLGYHFVAFLGLLFIVSSIEIVYFVLDSVEKRYIILEASGVSGVQSYLLRRLVYIAGYELVFLIVAVLVVSVYMYSLVSLPLGDVLLFVAFSLLMLYSLAMAAALFTLSLARDRAQGVLVLLLFSLAMTLPAFLGQDGGSGVTLFHTIVYAAWVLDPGGSVILRLEGYPLEYYVGVVLAGVALFVARVGRYEV